MLKPLVYLVGCVIVRDVRLELTDRHTHTHTHTHKKQQQRCGTFVYVNFFSRSIILSAVGTGECVTLPYKQAHHIFDSDTVHTRRQLLLNTHVLLPEEHIHLCNVVCKAKLTTCSCSY